MGAALGRTVKNRTLQRVIRTGENRTTLALRGICGTGASPPSGGLWGPGIVNKRQSTYPNSCKSNKLGASVDVNLSDIRLRNPVITQVFSDKLSKSYIRYIYVRCRMHLATDPINPVAPPFVTHGFSTIDALNKGDVIWSPDIVVRR